MRKGDIWQYDNLTLEEQHQLQQREDLPCAICGAIPAEEKISGSGNFRNKESTDNHLEAYCTKCMTAAYEKARHLEENTYTYRQVDAYWYRWNIAHQRARAAANKRAKETTK